MGQAKVPEMTPAQHEAQKALVIKAATTERPHDIYPDSKVRG
jgi:hypothetical protein